MSDWGFETRQVHAGAEPDPTTGARAVPIYQTTSFVFRDTEHAAALFGLEELGNIYTRIMNPTQAVFEERVAALEGGVGALATASGQAAQTIALLNLAENGGHIVASASLYGGTYNQLHYTFPKLGVEVTLHRRPRRPRRVEGGDPAEHKAFYGESIGNPKGDILDLEGISAVAHEAGIPLVIDNTVATPVPAATRCSGAPTSSCTRPRSSSAATARRSAGSSSTAASSTTSPAAASPTSPSPTRATTASSSRSCPSRCARRSTSSRRGCSTSATSAPAISPFNSFLFLQGLETLSLRMERHSQNALAVAKWLEARDEVEWVAYPGLASSRWNDRAKKYLPKGQGAIVAFGIKGGLEAGQSFINGLELISHLANVGDVRSPGHPPGDHDAPAARRGGAVRDRRHARSRAALGGHRVARRTSRPTWRRASGPRRARNVTGA